MVQHKSTAEQHWCIMSVLCAVSSDACKLICCCGTCFIFVMIHRLCMLLLKFITNQYENLAIDLPWLQCLVGGKNKYSQKQCFQFLKHLISHEALCVPVITDQLLLIQQTLCMLRSAGGKEHITCWRVIYSMHVWFVVERKLPVTTCNEQKTQKCSTVSGSRVSLLTFQTIQRLFKCRPQMTGSVSHNPLCFSDYLSHFLWMKSGKQVGNIHQSALKKGRADFPFLPE